MGKFSHTWYYLTHLSHIGAIGPVCDVASDYIIQYVHQYISITKKDIRILELGPGTGNITKKMVEKFPDISIVCVEKDKYLAKYCTRLFISHPSVSVICDDALHIDTYFTGETFDIIITTIPLSFLGVKGSIVLKKLFNILCDKGCLISGQVRSKQNTLYNSYIGPLLFKKLFWSIQPIVVTGRQKEYAKDFIFYFPSMKPWGLKQRIFRIRELFGGIQLQRDILPRVQELNDYTVPCSFSYLPLVSYTEQEANDTLEEYLKLIEIIHYQNEKNAIVNDVTIKLYQFGQYLDYDLCKTLLVKLVSVSSQYHIRIWFDTSDRVYYTGRNIIDETISLYEEVLHLVSEQGIFPCTGICLQSYHRRTDADMEYLISRGYVVRLVKGFYADGDITDWGTVTTHYEELAKKYLNHTSLSTLALATHDKPLIKTILQHIRDCNITKDKYEIQGFWGIQDQYYVDLADRGYPVRIYIPYGNLLQFVWRGVRWMDRKRILKRIIGIQQL